MAIKTLTSLTTLPTDNEQTGVAPRTSAAGTYLSREYGDLSRVARALFLLQVSNIAGSPTLDVTIEGLDPVANTWRTVVTFPQVTAISAPAPITVDPLYYQIIRAKWVVGGTGTPSVTFTLCALGVSEEPVVAES